MRNRKPLPIGVSDFEEIVENNYYYIDKTKLIEDILYYRAKVNLFTRPRRFGKTLNMSMMKYFFDVENKEKNRKLFDGMKISESEFMQEQGQYPVVYISFKNMEEENWENCLNQARELIRNVYMEFRFIRKKLNEFDLMDFDNICFNNEKANWKGSLKALTKYLYEYYGKKVVVLIDEYDTPIIQAYQEGYYKQAISFFKKFYGDAMKDNEYLQFGIMTGILRIAKEGIFSGLNNLKVNNIFSEKYSEYYGLTENEVVEAAKYYDLEYEMEDVREWYDGYQFGKTEIYNPWSIINFLDEKTLHPYWIGVSGNKAIYDLLGKADKEVIEDLEKLFKGETVYKAINDYIRLSERETGHGRADLVLEPKNKINPAYIFEFKAVNTEDELESYAKTGFEQIKEKKYETELKSRGAGKIVCVGLAFYRKKLKMKYEIVEK